MKTVYPNTRFPLILLTVQLLVFGISVTGNAVSASEHARPVVTLEGVQDLTREHRYAEAEVTARKLLAKTEAEHGANSVETAGVLDALALLLHERGDYDAARPLCARALAVRGKIPESAPPACSRLYGDYESGYIRLARDHAGEPMALEAAVVRFAPKNGSLKGPSVDLVAAIHVADKSYYEKLNRLFANYDAVLYEAVTDEGDGLQDTKFEGDGSLLSRLQSSMGDLLELEFQLQHIDYTRKNMVHADMTRTQLAESMRKGGESAFQIFARIMSYSMARQSQNSSGAGDFSLLLALFGENRAQILKKALAEELADMESFLEVLEGPEGSPLIGERNKVALQVLKKEITAGKQTFAIFYGGGHMPDFAERLWTEFNMEPVSILWLTAWDLRE